MRTRLLLPTILALLTLPALAQEAQCPSIPELRRGADDLLKSPPLRNFLGDARGRVIRVTCEIRDKEAPRPLAIAWIVRYDTGAAAEVTFAPGNFERAEVRAVRGRPQSSIEEREEARAIVREALRLDSNVILEGGFVVDPPEGSPPGRYLELHVLSPDRRNILAEAIVDMGRRAVAANRKYEAGR